MKPLQPRPTPGQKGTAGFPLFEETFPIASRRPAALAAAVLFSALAALAPCRALDPAKAPTQYIHSSWQSEDGLPQNSVGAIVQDRTGYLWLGTQEGLVRFDGATFTVYNKWNTPAIGNNNIRALCLDASGRLWIGTNGAGLVRKDDDGFTAFTTRDGLVYDNVTSLCGTSDGAVWAGTYGGGLSRLKDGRFTNFTTREGLPHDSILSLCDDGAGGLWIGTNGAGACLWTGGRFEPLAGLPNPVVYALCRSRDGSVWLGTYGGGLSRLKDGTLTTYTERDGLSSNRILNVLEDSAANIWVGTFGGGLCRLASGRWAAFTTGQGLPYDVVRALLEDREGNLWIGMNGGGLSRLHDGRFTTWGVPEGLPNDFAIGILEDRDGSLWIGTNGGGLAHFREGRFETLSTRNGMPNDLIRALFQDKDGVLWVGTDGGGLVKVSGRTLTVLDTRDGLSSNRVIAVNGDREGNLWLGTNGGGLCRLRNGVVTRYTSPGRVAGGLVNGIFEDSQGRLWVSTYGGLSRFEGGRFTGFPGQEAIGQAIVTHIHEDADGAIWLGTIGSGIFRLSEGRVQQWTRPRGLPDDTAYEILEDGAGRFWVGGNRGVFRVAKSDLLAQAEGRLAEVPFTQFGISDGMRSEECNGGFVPSGCRTRDGRLWFPTIRGIACVDPALSAVNAEPPPVIIEDVLVDGRPMDLRAPVSIPPGRHRVEVRYTGLSYIAPERVRFRYRLQGLDPGWVEAGNGRHATFTTLPPGRYTFSVTACNNDGVWNRSGASLSIVQRPRFTQTAPFYALCVLALAAVVAVAVRLRVRSLESRERELEALVLQRTAALEDANERLALLSRQDPLTGLANRRRFDEHFETQWRLLARSGEPMALIMADIDHFKKYNDTYGHPAGDECLRRIADLLGAAAKRAGDLASRYGGEEFALVLSGTGASDAEAIAESLRAEVMALAIRHEGSPQGVVTLSLGVASVVPSDPTGWMGLLIASDHALYQAKEGGRNQVRLAPSG